MYKENDKVKLKDGREGTVITAVSATSYYVNVALPDGTWNGIFLTDDDIEGAI